MVLCVSIMNEEFFSCDWFTHWRLQREWKHAVAIAEILLKENNWSKATSCYLLATFQFEENNAVATEEIIQLYK